MDTKIGVKSEFYGNEFKMDSDNNLEVEVAGNKSLLPSFCNEFKTNHNDNLKVEVTSNKSLLPSPCLAKHNILENIASMIEFNIICSSPSTKLVFVIVD